VDTLNSLIPGTEFENASLEEIIKKSSGKIFNQAAQVWNHTFYWNCLSPQGGGEPTGAIADAIQRSFGSFDDFKKTFNEKTISIFGSGWCWLVKLGDKIDIWQGKDAGNPITENKVPLLTCDIWEHAYYIDYRNARPKYMEAFWNVVNWDYVNRKLAG
jgi:Fe-Mn family superoxide dismutase